MNTIASTIITALCSSGFMSFVMYLITRHDRRKDEAKANKSAQSLMLLGIAHDKILFVTDKIIDRGGITLKEKTNLKYLYEPYHSLGGNGDCETGYEECMKLPIISDEDAKARDIEIKRKEFHLC